MSEEYAVCAIPNCRKRAPHDQAFCAEHRTGTPTPAPVGEVTGDLVNRAHTAFVFEAAKIERGTRLDSLTVGEEKRLVKAVLAQAADAIASRDKVIGELVAACQARIGALRLGTLEDEGKADELIRSALRNAGGEA